MASDLNSIFRAAFRPSGMAARYAVAIATVILAVYLRILLAPLFHGIVPYHMIWAALTFVAWRCGLGPSIAASVLCLLAVSVRFSFLPASSVSQNGISGMISFAVFSGIIVAMGESSRRTVARREKAEREAWRSHLLFETFMDNSPGAAFMKDKEGKYVYINRTGRGKMNLALVEGKTDFDIFPADAANRFRANDLEVLSDGKAREFLESLDGPEGRRFWMSIKFMIRDSDGNAFLCGKSFDVTDRILTQDALEAAHRELEERVNERTAELVAARDSLRELSARILQIRDEERRRIARELHDSVGQLLAALSMIIAALNRDPERLPPETAKLASEAVDLLEQVNREIRTMSHLLHPPLLDEVGLDSTLRWYVDGFTQRSGIQVTLQTSLGVDRLSQEVELTVFRIVQECLTNIHRHSGSKTAGICVDREDDRLRLEVKDVGAGIPHDKQIDGGDGRLGVGIRGMRERLRLLGGKLEIESGREGTIIRAVLPLSRKTSFLLQPQVETI